MSESYRKIIGKSTNFRDVVENLVTFQIEIFKLK